MVAVQGQFWKSSLPFPNIGHRQQPGDCQLHTGLDLVHDLQQAYVLLLELVKQRGGVVTRAPV